MADAAAEKAGRILAQRARLLTNVVRVMALLLAVGVVEALAETRNDWRATLGFYGTVGAGLWALHRAVRRGRVVGAAWVLSAVFWVTIALVTLFFGGLQGQNAACFGVSAFLVGSVIGRKEAIATAFASSAWCAFVVFLEVNGLLPAPLGPSYSPFNAWMAFNVALILMTVLLLDSLDSLREMNRQTEAAAAERDEALRRSIQGQKMELVGRLTSGIAHDLNNLLTVMASVADLLRGDPEPGTRHEAVRALEDATRRASLMTRQLLALGRKRREEPEVLDLAQQVRELAPVLQRLLGSRVRLAVQADGAAPVRATPAGIEQVVLNLAVNARDAMPDGGPLDLCVEADGAQVRLVVRDAGVGMDAATRERLFTPFFTTKETGTGLGLATVHSRVAEFGGEVRVQSSPGEGSTFEVRLPRADPAGPAAAP